MVGPHAVCRIAKIFVFNCTSISNADVDLKSIISSGQIQETCSCHLANTSHI